MVPCQKTIAIPSWSKIDHCYALMHIVQHFKYFELISTVYYYFHLCFDIAILISISGFVFLGRLGLTVDICMSICIYLYLFILVFMSVFVFLGRLGGTVEGSF